MEDERKRYDITCPRCGHKMQAHTSIAQSTFGMLDAGHGTCSKCGLLMNLIFDPKAETMTAWDWNDFSKEVTVHD